MKHFDKISSVIWLLIAIFFIWQSALVPIGGLHKPGPGFMPFWVAVILAMLSIILWVEAALRKTEEEVKFLSGEGKWSSVIWTVGPLLAYSFLVELLGFILSTLILLFFLFRYIGNQKWWVAITGSFLVTFSAHLIFKVALKVQLPYGILRF
jgi:putative tricarboxylic transport membrane protein